MTDLRRHARTIENQIDAKLMQYSRLDSGASATGAGASSSGPGAAQLQRDLEALLAQLSETNDKMSRHASAEGGGVAASMHVLQRHREILRDFQQEFNKITANQKLSDQREQLLSSVQNDIREARKAAGGTDALLREQTAREVAEQGDHAEELRLTKC